MITREITNLKEFETLHNVIHSLADDYDEMLNCLIEVNEDSYSLPYTYSRLLIFKGDFERALEGLRQTSLLLTLYDKLNGQFQQFYVNKEQFRHRLLHFLQTCRQDEALRQKIKAAADEAETNITVEKHRGLMQLHREKEISSLDVHSTLMAIDHQRLFLNERKNLGLQYIFNLQRVQEELELVFSEIERLFWENLPILRRFRAVLKEHREGFLILNDKKYPWWYPEKRKPKTQQSSSAH